MRRTGKTLPESTVCEKLTEIAEISASLFTIREFCSAVRISERQFYRIQAAGDGPRMIGLGGCKLISRSALNQWLWKHEER